jgi:hypothetical protein
MMKVTASIEIDATRRVELPPADPVVKRGRLFEWHAKRVLDAERRDHEHTMRELRYLKARLEGEAVQ